MHLLRDALLGNIRMLIALQLVPSFDVSMRLCTADSSSSKLMVGKMACVKTYNVQLFVNRPASQWLELHRSKRLSAAKVGKHEQQPQLTEEGQIQTPVQRL